MKVKPMTDAERWASLKQLMEGMRDTCQRQGWTSQVSYNEVVGMMLNKEDSVLCPHCNNEVRLSGQIGGKVKCDHCCEESEV